MKERPILFSAPMISAILEGRKTQTRRVINPQPEGKTLQSNLNGKWLSKKFNGLLLPKIEDLPIHCPYGKIGDRLWVRETFLHIDDTEDKFDGMGSQTYYKASSDTKSDRAYMEKHGLKWKPSIHMPRSACRLVLEITNIRVEQLQDISESDCLKEGVGSPILRDCKKPKFMQLWESINGTGSWNKNPWVWVVEFKVIQGGAA